MAKKATPKRTKQGSASTGKKGRKAAPAEKTEKKKEKKAPSKKAAVKKEKKAKRGALETQVLAAVEQFHKETAMLAAYAREFFNSLRKSGVDLPTKSRKALGSSAHDLRKTARTLKKLAGR